MDLAWLHPRSSSAPGPDCIGTYSASLANPFFYSSLGYHPFRSSSDIYAVAYSVTSFLHSSQHTQRFLGLGRLPLWRWRFFFRPFICAAPTQAIAVLLICILFGCGTFVPMPHCATDFAFPFYLFRFCCGVLSVVSIQAFLQQITVMASTTAPFTCWPGHQVHLRASCRHSVQASCLFRIRRLIPTTDWLTQIFSAYTDD